MYEAQVPRRADSPAYHLEHLQMALRLLGERRISVPATIGRLNLQSLLDAGIVLELPEGKELTIGVVQPQSPYVGKSIQSNGLIEFDDVQLLAILRQDQVLLPEPQTVLQAGDQILLISSPAAWEHLGQHLVPLLP